MKKVFSVILFIVCLVVSIPGFSQEKDYAGFHVGLVSGGGIAVQDGLMQTPAHLSFNLELGYDFGNQLDLIGRFGYSPFIGTDDTVIIAGTTVTPPSMIHILNFDFGLRIIPFSARFAPYFVVLLGVYNSRSNAQGTQVFNSQTGFHSVSGIGFHYRAGSHHAIGFEIDSHFFINDVNNIATLVFSAMYRYTF